MAKEAKAVEHIAIKAPNMRVIQITIVGTAPLIQNRMSRKALEQMRAKQAAGSTSVSKKGKRDARDFDADVLGALHLSEEGWIGIPASAFRNACIDVCRVVGFKMTMAKMSIFIEADGRDAVDGQPLVRLIADNYEHTEMPVRNQTGVVDIRARPMWREWRVDLRVQYDADQFTATDVANLLERAGMQCGVGEGRPFSKMSNGMGYGTFKIRRAA